MAENLIDRVIDALSGTSPVPFTPGVRLELVVQVEEINRFVRGRVLSAGKAMARLDVGNGGKLHINLIAYDAVLRVRGVRNPFAPNGNWIGHTPARQRQEGKRPWLPWRDGKLEV